ncbi:Bacterio-opsin activator, HTH domain protein, partial [mine drainage metagenome]
RADRGRPGAARHGLPSDGGEAIYTDPERPAALVRFPTCACCASGQVIPSIERMGDLYLPPSGYSSEGESYQFLAPGPRTGSALRDRLPGAVTVIRAGTKPLTSLAFEDGFLVPVGALSRGLTDRQRDAILAGIRQGYYRIPRRIRTEELARSFGISRPAYEALLRKAENRLVAALFPYLAAQGSGPDPVPGVLPAPGRGPSRQGPRPAEPKRPD